MTSIWRPLLAPAVLVSALLAGAYGVLVAPVNQRLTRARAERTALSDEIRSTQSACARIADVAEALRRTSEEADEVARLSRLATERTGVFDAVTSLAAAHRVQLGRVDPIEEAAAGTRESATVAPRARSAYSIEVRGGFGPLAAFVRDLQTGLGYTLVRSVRLTPAEDGPDGDTVAIIVTEHLAFDASPTRAGAEPEGGAP